MAPYTGQESGDPALEAVGADEVAAVIGYSPSPTPSPASTPSPPPEAAGGGQLDWQLAAADYLSLNYNLPNQLVQICGTEDLASVQDIRLRVVSREMSLQRLYVYLPNLTTLNLDGSIIVSLRELGCGMSNLRVLRVCRCDLESLDGLLGLTSLEELHAEGNRVEDVDSCACLPLVRVIDLRRNQINDIAYVQFLSICTELEELSLAGCPVSNDDGYRDSVMRFLPQLLSLDGQKIREPNPEAVVEEARARDDNGDGSSGASPRKTADDAEESDDSAPPSSGGNSTSFLPSIWAPGGSNGAQSRRSMPALNNRPSSAMAMVKLPELKSNNFQKKKRPVSATNEVCKLPENRLRDVHHGNRLKESMNGSRKIRMSSKQTDGKKITDSNQQTSASIQVRKKHDSSTATDYKSATEALSSDSCDVLEASRKWRAMYHSYRAKNRAKWLAEDKLSTDEPTKNEMKRRTITCWGEDSEICCGTDVSANLEASTLA